jgi:4-amino-4-deoxy-L-arabinose transferase-like glycosyltransferase
MQFPGNNLVKYILLTLLLSVPVFGHLNDQPIRIWDESRLAVNAYEMYKDGNWLVVHSEGRPEMWNTKPPLMIWSQVICMKVFGVNEIAVRFPSALAAFFTCVLLLVFSIRYLKRFWFGFIAILVLLTSEGYIGFHVMRWGEYDSMLVFFSTLCCFSYFSYLETKKNKYLYLAFIAVMLATLTKGVAAFLFFPGILIFSILQKELIPLLKNKHLYVGFLILVVPVLSYYLLREHYNPGYIQAVSENELGGRYLKGTVPEQLGFSYYYDHIIHFNYPDWIYYLPCGILVGLFHRDKRISKLLIFSFTLILCFFLVISFSTTKCFWYDAPLYPFMALMVAAFINLIFEWIPRIEALRIDLRSTQFLAFAFLFLVFIGPYRKTLDQTYLPEEFPWERDFYEVDYVLKDAVAGKINFDNCHFLMVGYYMHNLFYIDQLIDKGQHILVKDFKEKLEPGERIVLPNQEAYEYVDKNHTLTVLKKYGHVLICTVNGKKSV